MKNLTRQNPGQLFVAQALINKVKSKCCGIKDVHIAKAMGVNTEGMSVEEGICAAIAAVRKLSLSIGIPQRLREINVREEDLHQLAIDAFNDVCTGGNPRPTSVEDIEALYHKAF